MENSKNSQAVIIILLLILLIVVILGFIWYYATVTNSVIDSGENNSVTQNQTSQELALKDNEIASLKSQLQQKEQEILQLKQEDKNKTDENTASKLKEKDEKIASLEKANKEQKTTIDKLNKELNSIKSGINKRVKINSSDWRRASGEALLGTFRFDTLDNVEKIGVTFSNGYQKIDAVDVNSSKEDITMSLDKTKKTGIVSARILGESDGILHIYLEVYYTDGRTETIIEHVSMG